MCGYREVRGCGHVWIQRGKRVWSCVDTER